MLPIARPFGVERTAAGAFTRDCADSGAPQRFVSARAAAAAHENDRVVKGRIAGWSMCARIHSTGSAHGRRGVRNLLANVTRNKRRKCRTTNTDLSCSWYSMGGGTVRSERATRSGWL